MATSIKIATFNSQDQDYTILASHDYEAPIGKTFDLTKLQFDSSGNKEIKPGSIIVSILNSSLVRVLPLTKVAVAVNVGDTTVTVTDASIFTNGESLAVLRPYSKLTLGGTVATGNTVSVVIQGQTYTYTLLSSDSSTTIAAVSLAAFLNAVAVDRITAVASGSIVSLFSKTQNPYLISTSVTGGGITSVASDAALQENVALAAIHASTAINTTGNIITLATASAIALPVGSPIGVMAPYSSLLGITVKRQLIASTQTLLSGLSNDVPIYWEADVWLNALPYWDTAIGQTLSNIHTVV